MVGHFALLLAAGLATSPADGSEPGPAEDSLARSPPVLPAERQDDITPSSASTPGGEDTTAATTVLVEPNADAEREAFLARQPKDLRHPFLLAQRRTPTEAGRVERDLKDPFVHPRSPNAGSESVPADLRDPFHHVAPMPPVEFPAPPAPSGRCADDLPGVLIQRPRALQQELCGTAAVDSTIDPAHRHQDALVAQPTLRLRPTSTRRS